MSKHFAGNDSALAGPALRAFNQIAKAWSLTTSERSAVLAQPEDIVVTVAQTGVVEELPPETLERISYVLGIYHALHTIFPNQAQADGWIRRPSTAGLFKGATALALMCSGKIEDLASVRAFLEAGGLVDSSL
ncbi:MAG: hypothetical protein ABS932_02605 [Stenotrophomonas sp.]|uniref:hypothetical protein n=1 Tax=Stenotrophomonas TaxID=40323 RepID=UPI003315850E